MAGWYFFCVFFLLFSVGVAESNKEKCEDDTIGCEEFAIETCTSFTKWAETFCPAYCGLCPHCDEGWSLYNPDKTCLKVFGKNDRSKKVHWDLARELCQQHGGSLVQIHNMDKNDFVMEMLEASLINPLSDQVWLGVKNYPTPDNKFNFKYVDGSPFVQNGTTFPPWLPENPDNYHGSERCVTMYPKGNFPGQWNDYHCNYLLGYICSKPADKTS